MEKEGMEQGGRGSTAGRQGTGNDGDAAKSEERREAVSLAPYIPVEHRKRISERWRALFLQPLTLVMTFR